MTEQSDGANHSVMRELNRSLVLRHLMESGPVSRADLARETTLAKPTVSGIVDDLLSEGMVREIGRGHATAVGGRPPMLLEFNPGFQHFIGIQVGVQRTNIVIADALGDEVLRLRVATPRGPGAEALLDLIGVLHDEVVSKRTAGSSLAAIGICLPGLVDARTGVCLVAPNLGWRDVPIRELVEAEVGVPVVVANTPDVSLVSEHFDGCARGIDNVALLYVGRGVGGAVIADGQLMEGYRGLATEIGHCAVPGVERLCRCGNVGCLETVCDGEAIARMAAEGIAEDRDSSLKDAGPRSRITASDVGHAANEGDEFAREILYDVAQLLGLAASWMVNLFNPEMLVLAGGVANAGEPLIAPLREALARHALPDNHKDLRVEPWTGGRDAGVSGAVLLARRASDSSYRLVRG